MSEKVLSINIALGNHDNGSAENNAAHSAWHNLEKVMNKLMQLVMAVAVIGLMTGCETTGLSPREYSGLDYPGYVLSLSRNRTEVPPQSPALPVRLAAAQIGEIAPPQTMLENLEANSNLIASVVSLPLPADSINNFGTRRLGQASGDYASRVKAVCNLAEAAGANYVFLIGGNVDSWTSQNSLGMFDLTLVGGWIIPGTKINAEGKGAGVLIEATTGQPVFFVNAEYQESALSPDFLSAGKTTNMRAQVRSELATKLSKALQKELVEEK
jgi:hypothetical protein